MDFKAIYNEYFLKDFEEQLPQIKEQIINYLNNQHESVSISIEVDILDEVLARDKDPNYKPKFIEVTEEGIKLQILNEELIDTIAQYLPKDIKSANLPIEILNTKTDCIHNLKELQSLTSDSFGEITYENFQTLVEGTNIKDVNFEYCNIQGIEEIENKNYRSDIGSFKIKKGDLSISCHSDSNKGIHLSTPLTEDGLSLITPDLLEKGTIQNIFINDRNVIELSNGSMEIVLSDNVQETIQLAQMIFARTGKYPAKIDFKVQNKTYPNFEALKQFEDKMEVIISYGAIDHATIDEFEAMRATLDYYKMLIQQNDLSPAERICYAYDLIKSNIYRESENDKRESREIHSIVSTGNIVCVGYANFLAQLLKEVGIKANAISTKVPIEDGKLAGHQRNLVEINDEKYGIQGTYAFDCTWDSNEDIKVVERDGEEKVVRTVKETDTLLRKLDPMSMYTYFFIPSSEYNLYFPGEELHENIEEWDQKEFDPNEAALEEIPTLKDEQKATGNYDTTEEIPEDKIIEIIYNTRKCEGYSDEINQQLLQEVEIIRSLRGPKELRSEEGMRL